MGSYNDIINFDGSMDVAFKNDGFNFIGKPIGLYSKCYDFMLEHLYRNIGNREFTYDGYSTPIGSLANPFYNSETKVPWFLDDDYKNATSNYLEYIRNVYGATIGVENINENNFFKIVDEASFVGVFETGNLISNKGSYINPNRTGKDTELGDLGAFYAYGTLTNAIASNGKRKTREYAITSLVPKYFGLNSIAIKQHNIQNISDRRSPSDGRFDALSPLTSVKSPVYNSNFGILDNLGSYTDYYDSLSVKTKYFYDVSKGRNKYYIDNDGNEKTYFRENGVFTDFDTNINEINIRHIFTTLPQHKNMSDSSNGGVYVYSESEYGVAPDIVAASYNAGAKFSRYTTYGEGLTVNDLLKKTNDSFKNSKYKTIIARFHTDGPGEVDDTTQTAISNQYGMSHGRNLLKVTPDDSEGYENPYCRVWTYHHQYHRLADAIRPLGYTADELYNTYNFSAFTATHPGYDFEDGRTRLERFGTLNKNGMVNITPVDNGDTNKKIDVRNCMFSIENLAWKDTFSTDQQSRETFQMGGLSPEQKGPFGGRIMWFPPYGLSFNEDVNVDWNETNFIGRGEGIYTYTNTKRTGTLKFKLLVDHPSIIDYWENRGKSVSNSVDSIDDPEQEILRFFAGCDMLVSKPGPEPNPDNSSIQRDDAEPMPTTSCIKFFVFFPNNYSGVDDDYPFAVKYLANGLGAGEERKWYKDSDGVCRQSDETTRYEIPSAEASNGYGGYEIRPGKPISIVSEQTKGDLLITNTKIGKGGNTKSAGPKNTTPCNDGMTSLYAYDGGSGEEWWQKKWYYRIDKVYKEQLLKKESYIDRASYGLNSIYGTKKVMELFGLTENDEYTVYSFADVYAALEGNDVVWPKGDYFNGVNTMTILDLKDRKRIDHIDCIGRASKQGIHPLNVDLAANRARTIKKWLGDRKLCDPSKIKAFNGGTGGEGEGINSGDESAIENKKWRCVEVNIYVKEEASKTVQEATSENILKGGTSVDGSLTENHELNLVQGNMTNIGATNIPTFKDMSANMFFADRFTFDKWTDKNWLHKTNDGINGLVLNNREPNRLRYVTMSGQFDATNDYSQNGNRYGSDDYAYLSNYNRGKSDTDYSVDYMHDNAAKSDHSLNNSEEERTSYDISQGQNNVEARYDNESKFFSMLEKEEPFLHQKISDKVKFFDPAFHSISPEGFNARLTFLHQCTRQGPTVGASDNYTAENTANNLSFGRPPVCILRLGDFYYTKIIIGGISIDFDPLVWDLNTEGIGVMPMIADVTIRFTFIGGSSLAGHITRLQNAASFNYYANTEVYDNRSELAEYDENGNITKFAPYNPTK